MVPFPFPFNRSDDFRLLKYQLQVCSFRIVSFVRVHKKDKNDIHKSIYVQIRCHFKKIQLRDLDLEDII